MNCPVHYLEVQDIITSVTVRPGDVIQFPIIDETSTFIEWGPKCVVLGLYDALRPSTIDAGKICEVDGKEFLPGAGTEWSPFRLTGEEPWTLRRIAEAIQHFSGGEQIVSVEEIEAEWADDTSMLLQ